VGVIAADTLQAQLHLGKPSEEVKIGVEYDAYLHGMGSALRQDHIQRQAVKGSYLQGYSWVVSQTEYIQKYKEWFRINWTSPLVLLTGKKVWNQSPVGDKGRWYTLVLRAAQTKVVGNPLDFIISQPERMRIFAKTEWAFQKGAVFTEFERDAMERSVHNELAAYQRVIDELKNPTIHTIEGFKERLEEVAKPLRSYNAHVQAIASQRASYLYNPRMKKILGKGAYLLEDRFSMLTLHDWIEASNATGLLFDYRNRIPIKIRDRRAPIEDVLYILRNIEFQVSSSDTLGRAWIENALERVRRQKHSEDEEAKGRFANVVSGPQDWGEDTV
jgi:hypothetical protein